MHNMEFYSFGADDERIYGLLTEEDTISLLPECEAKMTLSAIGDARREDPLPEQAMEQFLVYWDRNGAIDEGGKLVLELYHDFAEKLSAIDNPAGLSAKAYGCYGGYNSFECDWYASRDCLLKLIEVDYKPFYADTLGYIYYYGRCNNGVPQYEEAFKYYTMAAFAGNYEATYKLADMFANGYYVRKDEDAAYNMIRKLYDENLPFITHGEFLSAFADIVFRLAKLLKNVLDMGERAHAYEVYRYLLQAEFAIRMRIATYDQSYGDTTVLRKITRALEEQRKLCVPFLETDGPTYYKVGLVYLSLPEAAIRMNVEHGEDTILKFNPLYNDLKNVQPRFLLTLPGMHYCGLCDELVFRVVRSDKAIPEGEYVFDHVEDDHLYFAGQHILTLDAALELIEPRLTDEKEYLLIGVRTCANGEIIDCLCEDDSVQPGDIVYAEGIGGAARVVKMSRRKGSELANPPAFYEVIKEARKKKQ